MSKIKSFLKSIVFNKYGEINKWLYVLLHILAVPLMYFSSMWLLNSLFGWNRSGSVLVSVIITTIVSTIYLSVVVSETFDALLLVLFVFCLGYGEYQSEEVRNNPQHYVLQPDNIIKDSNSVKVIKGDILITSYDIRDYNNKNIKVCYDTHVDGFEHIHTSKLYICND